MDEQLRQFIRDRAQGNAKFLNLANRGPDMMMCYVTAFYEGAATAVREYKKMQKGKKR